VGVLSKSTYGVADVGAGSKQSFVVNTGESNIRGYSFAVLGIHRFALQPLNLCMTSTKSCTLSEMEGYNEEGVFRLCPGFRGSRPELCIGCFTGDNEERFLRVYGYLVQVCTHCGGIYDLQERRDWHISTEVTSESSEE
jgi:hypothetical protein